MSDRATTDDERLLITGAGGYLAHRLVPMAAERAPTVCVSRSEPSADDLGGAAWCQLDLLDADAVLAMVADVAPTAIVSAAAANPGQGESWAINTDGARNLATAAAAVGARLVHVSTDIVHRGGAGPYADDAEPDPINDYGRTKAEGERIVSEMCPGAAVVRTSLIYGLDRIDRGTESFVNRLHALGDGETMSLWADAIRHPVWIDAFSEGLLRLALDLPDVAGSLNLAGEQAVSRADFGRAMLAWWGESTDRCVDGSAADVPGQALDLSLRFDRARELGLALPGVDEVLGRRSRSQQLKVSG